MNVRETLNQASLFQGLSGEGRDRLAAVARQFSFQKDEQLFRLGDTVDTLYVVTEGVVELTMPLKVLGVAKEVVIEELSPTSALAWSAMVKPHLLTMSARAKQSCELLGFLREELLAQFEEDPYLGWKLTANLAQVIGHRLELTKAMWFAELQRAISGKYG
jgi:CRP-like cAMP-binding protein